MTIPMRKIARSTAFVALNLWIVFHLFAVFVAPAGMPPTSPVAIESHEFARPYNEMLFLNHGYHYFAPDPAGSTLIEYSGETAGGERFDGRFPDRAISPRLRYHRYFMLADNLLAFPPEVRNEVTAAYARHFAQQHNLAHIRLFLVNHDFSSPQRVRAGGRLTDPETYSKELLGEFDGENSGRRVAANQD